MLTAADTIAGASADPRVDPRPADIRLVIAASSLGTVFEWYDFFVYGILAALLGKLFFPSGNDTAAVLLSLATFGAGFGVRPVGAILFGWFGDRIGRKYTFLVTITLMGGATAAIGILPTYAGAGLWAPVLLVSLRLLQGLALGGEYGGAAIYVAEHAPPGKRGRYTSFIQMSVVGGFLLSLIIVLASRHAMDKAAFEAWGWRIPFLSSLAMLAVSLYMRLKLSESPVFRAMKAAGATSTNPILDSLKHPGNPKRLFVAMIGVAAGLTVIYYNSQFYTLYFLQGTARIAEEEALAYMAIGAGLAAPLYVVFGALSDRVGRKKLLLGGYALAMLAVFPIYHMMADAANPALARASAAAPVTLQLPSCDYSVFAAKQQSPCAQALAYLSKRGIGYAKVAPRDTGTVAITVAITVGRTRIAGFDDKAYTAALVAAGYPDTASPAEKRPLVIILGVFLMVALSAMTYGQVAAILVEMFPARIRYTSLSVPYHIGTGWFGGFLPFISQYIVARTGDTYAGLWYTVAVVAVAFVVSAIWLEETAHKPLDDPGAPA